MECTSCTADPDCRLRSRLNDQTISLSAALPPVPFLLSDIRPHPSWPALKAKSDNLSYIPHSVNATLCANIASSDKKQLRTLFVSFHHMNEEGARKVIEDAMRHAEALVYVLVILTWGKAEG